MISKLWQKRTLINKKIKFCIYNFFIKGSLGVVFDVYTFANMNFMRKKERK